MDAFVSIRPEAHVSKTARHLQGTKRYRDKGGIAERPFGFLLIFDQHLGAFST